MKFSIVIPVYNVEKYLSSCIESILSQTFSDYELILVDDGSKDHSSIICDEYARKDNRIRVIHKKNTGQSNSRNIGLNIAKGDYVIFIDSDDYFYHESVLKQLEQKTVSNPDVIVYKFIKWYESTNTFGKCGFDFCIPMKDRSLSDITCELIDKDAFYNCVWTKVLKRTLLVNNHIQFREGIQAEDNDWYYNVLLHTTTIEYVDSVYYVYRQREGSTTHSINIKPSVDLLFLLNDWIKHLGLKNKLSESLEGTEKIIVHSMAKQYCNVLIGLSKSANFNKYISELKAISFLLNYSNNRRVVFFRYLNRFLGIKGTLSLLKLIRK